MAAPTVRLPHQQPLSLSESPCSLLVVVSDCSRESLPRGRLFLRQLLLHIQVRKTNYVAVTIHTLIPSPPSPTRGCGCKSGSTRENVSYVSRVDRKRSKSMTITREAGARLTTSPAATLPSRLSLQRQRAVPPEVFHYVRATSEVRDIHPCPRLPPLRSVYRTPLEAGETWIALVYRGTTAAELQPIYT